jgi:nitroreductase
MEFKELIRTRESIRTYDKDTIVPEEVLERILDAGRMAPSACNYQPWKFLLVSSPEMLEKVKACYAREWLGDAPHILITVGLKDKAWERSFDRYNSVETDVAIALTHIILAAENEGVATCWIANYNPSMLREALKIPDNEEIFGITPLGYPKPGFKKLLAKKRKRLDEIVLNL